MINKLLGLKENNKVLFWILIPLVALAFIVKILMELNIIGAKRDLKKAENNVLEIQKQKEEAERKAKELIESSKKNDEKAKNHHVKADEHKANAEKLEKEKPKIDENWHLKD